MKAQERRRRRLLKAISAYQEKLDRLDPAKYRREVDYRKARTFYEHRIAGLKKLLEGGDNDLSCVPQETDCQAGHRVPDVPAIHHGVYRHQAS